MEIAGEKIYPIGLGTWHMGDDLVKRTAELAALQTGLKQASSTVKIAIDTAEMYGDGNSEELVGKALQSVSRENVYLISKVYPWNATKEKLPQSLAASLKRLKTDYLDLYLLHWPGEVPLAETVTALEDAKKSGLIKNWGVSNFDLSDMQELWQLPAGKNCAANEVLYNLGNRGIEFDLLPWLNKQQVPLIAYSPIAQGDSLGNQFLQDGGLQEIAARHGVSIFQLLLAWAIRDEKTLAIPQSSNKDHVLTNLAAAKIQLTKKEWQKIAARYLAPTKKQPLAVL